MSAMSIGDQLREYAAQIAEQNQATLAADLVPDESCIYWGDKNWGGTDGWAYRAKR
jgi:hypothetical protein